MELNLSVSTLTVNSVGEGTSPASVTLTATVVVSLAPWASTTFAPKVKLLAARLTRECSRIYVTDG